VTYRRRSANWPGAARCPDRVTDIDATTGPPYDCDCFDARAGAARRFRSGDIISELLLEIGFLACDDAAEQAASEHSKATLLGFPEVRPRSVSLNAAPIEPFASLPVG
jgi:hypothetical protein